MKLNPLPAWAGILLLGLAASCTSGTDGIFASIESEEKIVSNGGLSETATVTHMAESTTLNKYFATGGRALFSRDTAATKWSKSTVGGSSEVAAVGASGTLVWAVADGTLYASPDGDTWTAQSLDDSSDQVVNLVPVRMADGYSADDLVVVTKDSDDSLSRVYFIDGGTLNTTGVDLTAANAAGGTLSAGVISAVTDGTVYYLASENYLWSVNSTFTTATKLTIDDGPNTGYQGLLYFGSTETLYLTTMSIDTTGGGIYSASVTAGTEATSVSFDGIKTNAKTSSSYPVWFTSMIYNATAGVFWVATGASTSTEGTGFAQVTQSGGYSLIPTSTSVNVSNYKSSDLPSSVISCLFQGSTGYFVGTVAHGLWYWKESSKKLSQQ